MSSTGARLLPVTSISIMQPMLGAFQLISCEQGIDAVLGRVFFLGSLLPGHRPSSSTTRRFKTWLCRILFTSFFYSLPFALFICFISPFPFRVSPFFLFFLFFFLIHAFRDILGREEGGEETQPHGNFPLPDSQPCSGKKQGWGRGKNHTTLKALEIRSCCFPECQGSVIWPCTRGRRTCAL